MSGSGSSQSYGGQLQVEALLRDRSTRVVLCCGAGGVGKTTTAAALALRAAESGRRVVVLTIDPARRLAQALGLRELGNVPTRVTGVGGTSGDGGSGEGDDIGGGTLDAMMLDMKRTFDEIVLSSAGPQRARAILANPIYQSLSSGLAGTQEYMAMEKLGQLRSSGEWDLVVVDTPPSRSALDFLDAPRRIGALLDSRFLRLLLTPARAGGRAYLRVLNVGVGAVGSVLTRVLGTEVLRDVQAFLGAFDSLFGGFRERAERTYQLLQEPGTAFLVVSAPEPDPLREASYFLERLRQERMPLAGLVLNRVHVPPPPELATLDAASSEVAAARARRDGDELSAGLLALHGDRLRRVEAQARLLSSFRAAHPAVPVTTVPEQPGDVHDLDGLRALGRDLSSA